jgi:hypothetical protein
MDLVRVLTSIIAIITTLLVWVPPSAAAEPSTAPVNGDELAKQSRRAYVVGNLEEAIKGFENAYQVSGDASLLFDLAEAQREAGHTNDALISYQNYLRRAPAGIYRKSAERQIHELKKARSLPVGAHSPSAPLEPKASPAPPRPQRASSTASPAPTAVAPTPPAAATRQPMQPPRSVTEAPTPTASPPGSGVASRPVASPAPRPLLALPEADSAIRPLPSSGTSPLLDPSAARISSGEAPDPGGPSTRAQVDLVTSPRSEPPPRSPAVASWVPIALGVIAIGLGTAGVFAGLSASHRYDDLHTGCGRTPEGCMPGDVDELRSRAHRANILWVATGVAGVGFGTALYFNLRDAGPTGRQVGGL